MNKRTKWLLSIGVIAALVLGFQVVAFASHPEVSLPGSNFEIDTDANLVLNDPAPSIDWASVPQGTTPGTEIRQADLPSGSGDDSFGQGAKEDTPVPTVVDGSIPNNKSDLKTFGGYLETTPSGARFLNLFWHRVQEPTGTTNMDFEFNQSSTLSANGVTPVRTAGDVLIQYDLTSGGTHPELFLSRWVTTGAGSQCQASNATPCWGTRVNLTTAGLATGSINTSPISAADSDGLGAMSARTFGEAQVDFSALTGGAGSCTTFGSAYLKSRSSDSFSAALKDFIKPTSLNLQNCGGVVIRKETIPDEDPNTTSFGYTKTFTTQPATGNTFTLVDDGSQSFSGVVQGTSTVTEDVIPAGWAFTSVDCSASTGVTVDTSAAPLISFNIDSANDIVDCTYTNTQQTGAIEILKDRKHAADGPGDHPHSGVDFEVSGGSLTGTETVTTDTAGRACIDGLTLSSVGTTGDYTVHEVTPTGYAANDDQNVTVDNTATCADDPYGGESVSFHNTPLTDLSVAVDSQVPGGTDSQINCVNDADSATSIASHDTDATGDGTASASNLEPGNYTCTVVIDP